MRKMIYALVFMLTPFVLHAQLSVTGKVTDISGEGLPGVAIVEKGTTNGTLTDPEGNYTLNLNGNSPVVVFSFLGFASQEIPVSQSATLDVQMLDQSFNLGGIEVVGTRSINRTVTESMSPIDVIDIQSVTNSQGQLDINQLLQYTAPSFNSNRQSGSDGADHIDPATLRGLGPDQTLVLINGKRQHQSALINIYGSRGRGNTGTDLNTIPASAIERIEILRDGASAQYGSDAIAGVINIVLKQNVNEFTGNVNTGAYNAQYNFDEGSLDGKNLQLNGNYGFRLGENGFINVTSDYHYRGHTNRADFTGDFPEDIDVRNQGGDAEVTDYSAWFNMNYPLNDKASLYAFGGYNFRTVEAYAYTRAADESRNVISIYPEGFDPVIASNVFDKTISAGVRGDVQGWNVDFNNTFGSNLMHYYGRHTLNASLVTNTPTEFDDGGFSLAQNTTSLDFTRYFENALKGLNIAYGAEYRVDNYNLFAGEEASYTNYGGIFIDSLFDDEGNFIELDTTTRPGGAQGFPGFQPKDEANEFRTNLGAYFDVEANFTDAFAVDGALRFENYSDFGNTLNWKIAGRYDITDKYAIRASASTGFRAPSLAQIYFSSTYTNVEGGVIFEEAIADNKSAITRLLGIPPLKQEESQNVSVGITAKPVQGLSITVDAYQVAIKDRIVLTDGFGTDDDVIGDDLSDLNVSFAKFFTNAVDTRTSGLDAIVSYKAYMKNDNTLNFTLAANFNDMVIDTVHTNELLEGKEQNYFSDRERAFLIASAPPVKLNFIIEYATAKFNANARFNYFGQIDLIDYDGNPYTYAASNSIDLSLGYDLTDNTHLTIGAVNLLNTYPDAYDPYETETGVAWDAVQMGFNGRFLFAKLGFKF